MNAELKDKNAEIPDLKRKFAEIESEKVELKARIAELLRQAVEESKRRDVENAELKARIEELEKNKTVTTKLESENAEFRDRITKVEQRQMLNDTSSNNSSPNFNSVADQLSMATHHEKPLVDKKMDTSLPEEPIPEVIAKQSVSAVNISVMDQCDQMTLEDQETNAFLDEVHKKKISDEIRQRNREKKLQAQESLPIGSQRDQRPQVLDSITQPCNSASSEALANSDGGEVPPKEKIGSEQDSKCKKGKSVNKLKQELFASELVSYKETPSIEQNYVTEISETLCPGKVTSDKSSIDEASQHLAQLCDKAFDAEDKANRANQEEILCWCLYAKDFIIQLNGIIESSGGKFGEKKARGLLYDSIAKQLNLLRKQRSQETGLQLRDVSRDSLRKKTQRAEKVYKFIERVGLDKIKYIKSYSATSISELTNEQIQEVIDYGISSEKLPLVTDHVTEISETLCPGKNLPKNTPPKTKNDQISAPIPSTHNSNSSSNSSGTGPVRMISPATPQASVSPVGLIQLVTDPILETRHWINILIYVGNLVVKISIIMALLTRHHARYAV